MFYKRKGSTVFLKILEVPEKGTRLQNVLVIIAFASFFYINLSIAADNGSTESVLESSVRFTGPVLLKEETIQYPLQLLKEGIEGTAKIHLDITKTGVVSDCQIVEGLHRLLDSLVCLSALTYKFSPALENDLPVESTVLLEIVFNQDSIIKSFESGKPDIEGHILDRFSHKPVNGATVGIVCKKPVQDKFLKIPLNHYFELIGKIKGQYYTNGKIMTKTDPSGYFSFRLLPESPLTIGVAAPGYKSAVFEEHPRSSSKTRVTYMIDSDNDVFLEEITDSICEIKVYGTEKNRESIDIDNRERVVGLTHYVSKIVLSHPALRQIPESGSEMLVRSAGPFDNRYIITGIPMMAPFHFAGHHYTCLDGLMIPSLEKIDIVTDRLAGMYSDVNGVIIRADPGVYRSEVKHARLRPELSIDYSNAGQNFLLSFPFNGKRKNFVQLALTRSESFTLKWLKLQRYDVYNPDLGPGHPGNYGDITLTGAFNTDKYKIAPFLWFAYDIYDKKDSQFLPWGMGSVQFSDNKNNGFSSVIGGSKQYYIQGKRYGNIYETFTGLTSGYFKAEKKKWLNGVVDLDIGFSLSGMKWTGKLTEKNENDNTGIVFLERSGLELNTEVTGAMQKKTGDLETGLDILGSLIFYENKSDILGDAGVYANWEKDRFVFGIHSGKVTSRPDIRGLPGEKFRQEKINTYLLSANAGCFFNKMDFHIEPYLRIQPVCPRTNPYTSIWKNNSSTKLLAYGVDLSGNSRIFKWMDLTWAFNAAHGYRDSSGVKLPYEWDVPWTLRGGACINAGEHVSLMLDGIISSGLPYFDLGNGGKLSRIPVHYKRINFGFDYRTHEINHRHITRFDVYFRAENLLDKGNVHDYYWNNDLEQFPIILRPLLIQIGARFGFCL